MKTNGKFNIKSRAYKVNPFPFEGVSKESFFVYFVLPDDQGTYLCLTIWDI